MGQLEETMIQRVGFKYPGVGRLVYPGLLQLASFVSMNASTHTKACTNQIFAVAKGEAGDHDKHNVFYDEYLAVMDLPDAYYLETIEKVFQEFHLARGCFRHRGRLVDPGAIVKTALMTIEGEKDDISSPGQTRAAHKLCTNIPDNRRLHHLQPGVGHYGTFNGRRWREEIAPKLQKFIRSA
jgi:poly(3-hydroxybutyrate) depolymerase